MLRFLTAGESHGQALVAIVEGMPAGVPIDVDAITSDLRRRQGGYGRGRRMAIESDRAEILSGVRRGHTTGGPIALLIPNKDWQNWQRTMSIAPEAPADATGANISAQSYSGTPDIAVMPLLTCDPTSGTTGDQIINPSCFTLPAPGQFGTYVFPSDIRGPSYINNDFAVFKNFNLGGVKRFQFRASFTNVFNHPQRALVDANNLQINFTDGVQSNQNFGILPQNNKYGRRIIQFAFKYYF